MDASVVPVVVFVSRVIHVALLWDGMGSVILGSMLGSSCFPPWHRRSEGVRARDE